MSTVTQPRYTYDDLRAMPDDGKRYELIDGVLVVTPAPSYEHQEVSGNVFAPLRNFVRTNRLGKVYDAPADIRFSEGAIVQPDVFFVSNARRHLLRGGQTLEGAPDLIVEVLSPSTRDVDLGRKLALYAASGVPEYWTVDLVMRAVTVYALVNGRYEVVPPDDGRIRSLVLPGLEIDSAGLFEDLW
jgi:Uma2 family endonuclease